MSINKNFVVKHGLDVAETVTATSFVGDGTQLTGVSHFSGSYNDLTNKPTIPVVPTALSAFANDTGFINSSALTWTNITGKPTFATVATSGSYTDLINKPTIPSLTGYATESYVNTQVANLVDSSPTALNTLNELAAALADDPNFSTTITNQLSLKANISSLATVATTGSYNDLLNKPDLTALTSVDTIQLDTTYNGPTPTGQLSWNSSDGTVDIGLNGGNVVLQVGQEQVQRIFNNTGSTLTEGTAVYISGAQGQRLTVGRAQANAESTSSKTFGVVTENIGVELEGYITTEGLVRNINTSAYPEGAALWLSPTTPGGITITKPAAPQHLVLVGFCVRQHATAGSIFVKVQNGYELDELHDVLINGKANNDVLKYDAATGVWKNAQLGAVAYSNSYSDLTNKPTNVSAFTNDSGYLTSVAGSALTGTSLASGIVSSSLTSIGTLSSLRVNGIVNLGTNTFAKASYNTGDIGLDNGSTDTPGILFCYANNKNWGIDSFYDTGSSKQILRFVSDLNESGGAQRATLDNTGKFTAASFAGNGSLLTGVIQTVQAVKTDVFIGTAPNNTTYTAITGLSATITPKSTSSKILIMTTINYDSTRNNSGGGFAIFRNGSRLDGAIGNANNNNYRVFGDFGANANQDQSGMSRSFQVIDSPSTTSALTYDIRFTQDSNGFTTYINKARYDDSSGAQTDDGRFASSIVLMEIA